MPTECSPDFFGFEPVEGRAVVAAFDAGAITSDAGALLLGATDRRLIPLTQARLYVVGAGSAGAFARIVSLDDVPIAGGLVVAGEPKQGFE